MQLMVWGLTEGGQVIGKTIRDCDWEEHEKNGYVKNPLHLPESESRMAKIFVKAKKQQLDRDVELKGKLEKVGDVEDESYENVCKSVALLEAEIKQQEDTLTLNQQELNQVGEGVAEAVEVENFLLNLGSERSKKKIWKFLDKRGISYDKGLTLKPLKKLCREVFKVED